MGLKLDGLTINEWLQTDQTFLTAARAVQQAFRQGQQAGEQVNSDRRGIVTG